MEAIEGIEGIEARLGQVTGLLERNIAVLSEALTAYRAVVAAVGPPGTTAHRIAKTLADLDGPRNAMEALEEALTDITERHAILEEEFQALLHRGYKLGCAATIAALEGKRPHLRAVGE